jgi:hypothetical protein
MLHTLAVNEDVGALSIRAEQYGVLVNLYFGEAWLLVHRL